MSTTSQTRSTAYAVMQRIFDEGFATGDGSVADELCSPSLVDHQFGTAGHGADAIAHVKDAMRDVHGAFPDIKFTIEDAVESGDTIWVRVRGQGTATGPYFGPPSGRPVDFTVIDVCRVVDGARQRKPYHSPRRAEQAIATRRAVLDAARELFIEHGYAVTTVADIARRARVAVDTVYAAVGRKPTLLREVLETAISGSDQAVPAERRDYVARVRAAKGARKKIEAYVAALVDIQPRLAPVYLALRDAAATDPDSAATWRERRARNMRRFAADLRATGELRTDVSDDDIADIVWSMNGPEYWTLLVTDRGWSPEQFGHHLTDAWQRLFLARAPEAASDERPAVSRA